MHNSQIKALEKEVKQAVNHLGVIIRNFQVILVLWDRVKFILVMLGFDVVNNMVQESGPEGLLREILSGGTMFLWGPFLLHWLITSTNYDI